MNESYVEIYRLFFGSCQKHKLTIEDAEKVLDRLKNDLKHLDVTFDEMKLFLI